MVIAVSDDPAFEADLRPVGTAAQRGRRRAGRLMLAALLAASVGVSVSGCGGSSTGSPAKPAAQVAKGSDKQSGEATSKTAKEIADAMSVAGAKVVEVSAEADSNHLLGRPNGYTSLAALVDPSLAKSGNGCSSKDPGTDCGAKIEVFEEAQGAETRKKYIQGLRAGGPLGTEYDTIVGSALLRVDGVMTPAAAKKYAAAFKKAAG